jgi:hypothetical protein
MKLSIHDIKGSTSFRKLNAGLFDPVRAVSPAVAKPDHKREVARQDQAQAGGKGRVVFSLIALRRRPLDADNNAASFKHFQDAIAESLGFDDGDERVTWQYQQMHTFGKEGVIVHVERIA